MEQIHRRCSADQVRMILDAYCQGVLGRTEAEDALHLGKTRFFALLRAFRQNPGAFALEYHRLSPSRLDSEVEAEIRSQLQQERALVMDTEMPIRDYNYTAMRDRLGTVVSRCRPARLSSERRRQGAIGHSLSVRDMTGRC